MGFSVPRRLRFARWSLTPPFHPYLQLLRIAGGIFSVALSVGTTHAVTSRVYPRMLSGLRGIAPYGVRTFLPRLAPRAILRPPRTNHTLEENLTTLKLRNDESSAKRLRPPADFQPLTARQLKDTVLTSQPMKAANNYMAVLFAIGALGSFGLSQKVSYTSQFHNPRGGNAMGSETVVYVTPAEKTGFRIIGAICMGLCIYFVVRTRNDDLRK
jgi:hypothetical protein